jgi:hypothetical protein
MEPQWGGEKSLTAAGKDHTLTDRVCTFKTIGLNAETKKSVGIEPTGEIFLLTFTLIGRFYYGGPKSEKEAVQKSVSS